MVGAERNIESEKNVRQRIIEVLELIASPQDQVEYQHNVDFVYIPHEIIEQWRDWVDNTRKHLYRTDIYTPEELKTIWAFDKVWDNVADRIDSGLTMEQMIESKPWRELIGAASMALLVFKEGTQAGKTQGS